jgi:hypothetical protein
MGGHQSAMNANMVNDVQQRLLASLSKSLSAVTGDLHVLCNVWKRSRKERIHPYCVTVFQELQPPDMQRKLAYCQRFHTFVAQNPETLDMIWFSDEAWFHLLGTSSHRICIYGPLQILMPFIRSSYIHWRRRCVFCHVPTQLAPFSSILLSIQYLPWYFSRISESAGWQGMDAR